MVLKFRSCMKSYLPMGMYTFLNDCWLNSLTEDSIYIYIYIYFFQSVRCLRHPDWLQDVADTVPCPRLVLSLEISMPGADIAVVGYIPPSISGR